MAKKISEHDALKSIDNMLETLSDEERQRVFDWIQLKYRIGASSAKSAISLTSSSFQPVPSLSPTGSIKDFLVQKRPIDNYEKIACIVYYLEKVQGVEGVKTSQITQGNKDARQAPFSNAAVFVSHAAVRHGLLTQIGGGKKALSAKGEAVVEALPDREKVSIAMAEYAGNKKSAKKSTNKKKIKA
jgi:hypothetical protein